MAIKTKDEILNSLQERFANDTSDEVLTFLEDITDTINDFDTKAKDNTNWKTRYEENDKEWREKYKERFFNSDVDGSGSGESDGEPEHITKFEDLFTVKEI